MTAKSLSDHILEVLAASDRPLRIADLLPELRTRRGRVEIAEVRQALFRLTDESRIQRSDDLRYRIPPVLRR